MNIYEAISSLVFYGEKEGLIEKEDEIYTRNRIMTVLSLDSFEDAEPKKDAELEAILSVILQYAEENGLCESSVVYRDLFDTKVMGTLVARPSDIIAEFRKKIQRISRRSHIILLSFEQKVELYKRIPYKK